MFVLYGLLGGASPPFSDEILLRELTQFFSGDERLAVSSRALPFGGKRVVVLSWPSWQVRVAYEEGDSVAEDSAEISRRLGWAGRARAISRAQGSGSALCSGTTTARNIRIRR